MLLAILLTLASCRPRHRQPSIGEAFVAPASLNLRQELAPRAPVTALVKHGDRLEILERKRRFAKVRTAEGAEGWTDGRQLLSPKGMQHLRRVNERAKALPSQGKASPFDDLNVHIAPNRSSPSFYLLPEGVMIDLVGRAVTPRGPYNPDQPNAESVPVDSIKDDWSMVRLPDGRSGWVLARMLMMNLPDEVTQMAEGHRITSCFPLDIVNDKNGQPRQSWLWTTSSKPPEDYQFDSFRVFVWNVRKNRYETTYVERGLRGYYPVTVEQKPGDASPRIRLVAGRDELFARTFEFRNRRLREIERRPYTKPVADPDDHLPMMIEDGEELSLWQRTRQWVSDRWLR
ncbi:MAG: hypothetical protein U0Q16_11745 [Bryobacteraceae bacterium]